jgi:hypothetical protein
MADKSKQKNQEEEDMKNLNFSEADFLRSRVKSKSMAYAKLVMKGYLLPEKRFFTEIWCQGLLSGTVKFLKNQQIFVNRMITSDLVPESFGCRFFLRHQQNFICRHY